MSDTQTIVVRDDARTYDVIPIGRQGEKNHKVIIFDLSEMIDKYGSGTATLVVRRSQDLAPYVVTTSTDTELEWTVSDTDTLYEGNGSAEIRYEFESEGLSKSVTYQTVCKSSITGEITVPSVMQSWYDAMMGYIKSNGNAGAGLTGDVINALLTCFEHVAWIDDDGQDYYDALETALQDIYWDVTNTLSHCTSSNSAETVLKGGSYTATITASTGYTLTGATVSVTMGETDITSTAYSNGAISIASVTGDLAISVTAAEVPATLVSIDATYSQFGTVYDTDSLDSLKEDLVVTATYDDSSSEEVGADDYTLSGTLEEGTSTITVTYEGKTDTFDVTVTHATVYTKNYTTDGTFVGSGIYANARSASENPNIKQDICPISNVQSGDVINLIVGWNESTYTSNKDRFISTASNTTPSMTDGTFVKHGTSYGEQPVTVNSDYDVLYVSVQNTNSSYAQYATWTRAGGF